MPDFQFVAPAELDVVEAVVHKKLPQHPDVLPAAYSKSARRTLSVLEA